MLEIIIDKDSCNGCAICVLACPTNCLCLDSSAMKAAVAAISECIVCKNCEEQCPRGILEVRLVDQLSREESTTE